jgi:hypothetical protein
MFASGVRSILIVLSIPPCFEFGPLDLWSQLVVGNNPDPVSPVRGVDGESWNNKRLDFVTFVFQVNTHLFEYHAFADSK